MAFPWRLIPAFFQKVSLGVFWYFRVGGSGGKFGNRGDFVGFLGVHVHLGDARRNSRALCGLFLLIFKIQIE